MEPVDKDKKANKIFDDLSDISSRIEENMDILCDHLKYDLEIKKMIESMNELGQLIGEARSQIGKRDWLDRDNLFSLTDKAFGLCEGFKLFILVLPPHIRKPLEQTINDTKKKIQELRDSPQTA